MPTNLIIRLPERLRLRVDSAERGASDLMAAITGTVLEGAPVPGMVCSLGPDAMAAAADLVDISWRCSPRDAGPVTLVLECASLAERNALLAAVTNSSVLAGRLRALTPPAGTS